MKKLFTSIAIVICLSVLASGCFRHRAVVTNAVPEAIPASWDWHHHLFWGLVELSRETALDQLCPQGIQRVETYMGPLQWILGIITVGIYVPTTVRVFCADKSVVRTIDLELDEQAIARIRARYPDIDTLLPAAIRKFAAQETAERARGELSTASSPPG